MEKGKVIAVTSVKGGVGKTTTVLNLAGMYSLMGKKTLIVDFDLYSSAICLMLNLDPVNDIYTLSEDISNNRYDDFMDYITKYDENIDIIAGPKDIRMSGRINSMFVPTILSKATNNYDVVLVDTNHFLNDINLTILQNSDKILYVVSNDPVDLKTMKSMVAIYKNMERENYAVLLYESIFKDRHTYKKYDVTKFLKHELNYHITDKFYIKNIDRYILDGKILTLDKKVKSSHKKIISYIRYMADSLLNKE